MVQDQQGQVSVRCPTCRRATLLPPPTTVADLQSAFHIHHLFDIRDAFEKVKEPEKVQCAKCMDITRTATSYCRDCGEFICAMCTEVHAHWGMFAEHEVVPLDQFEKKVKQLDCLKKVPLYCSLHEDKELELYCETCEELICTNCTVKKHKDHQYDLLSDTFEQQKAEITASLEPVEMRLETINKAIGQIERQSKAVKANIEDVEDEIKKEIEKLHNILELRKAELLSKVNEEGQVKLKRLATQKDEMETVQTQLVSCLTFVKESLKRGSQGEVMKMKKGVSRQIKEITDSIKPDKLPPCECPNMRFSPSPELTQNCRQFGTICTNISPKKCYAIGKGLEVAVQREKATAIVHLCDKEGRVSPEQVESLTCELTSDTSRRKIKGSVKKTEDGQFEISYQATSRGRHQLHIKVKGEHIKGSPFSVTVKLPVQELGTPVRSINGVKGPWGVAIHEWGEVVVVEYGRNCVSIFSLTGEKIRSFGSRGSDRGQFSGPCGVAIDDDGNILVVDGGNHRIQKFTADGRFITAVGTYGSGRLQFSYPTGIKFNSQTKRVYIVDRSNHRVQVLKPNLTFFSSLGDRPGQLTSPYDVAFDSVNNVYVTDYQNNQIQVFTENGEFLRHIGRRGTGQGELSGPIMITIDNEDKIIYVTEYSNYRVSVFTSDGIYLTSFGSWGNGPLQFKYPYGIAMDKLAMVYVCDHSNNRVQIF